MVEEDTLISLMGINRDRCFFMVIIEKISLTFKDFEKIYNNFSNVHLRM